MQNQQKEGKAEPSFVSNLLGDLESKENVQDEMEVIKNCAGMAYAGKFYSCCIDNTTHTFTSVVRYQLEPKV